MRTMNVSHTAVNASIPHSLCHFMNLIEVHDFINFIRYNTEIKL